MLTSLYLLSPRTIMIMIIIIWICDSMRMINVHSFYLNYFMLTVNIYWHERVLKRSICTFNLSLVNHLTSVNAILESTSSNSLSYNKLIWFLMTRYKDKSKRNKNRRWKNIFKYFEIFKIWIYFKIYFVTLSPIFASYILIYNNS